MNAELKPSGTLFFEMEKSCELSEYLPYSGRFASNFPPHPSPQAATMDLATWEVLSDPVQLTLSLILFSVRLRLAGTTGTNDSVLGRPWGLHEADLRGRD